MNYRMSNPENLSNQELIAQVRLCSKDMYIMEVCKRLEEAAQFPNDRLIEATVIEAELDEAEGITRYLLTDKQGNDYDAYNVMPVKRMMLHEEPVLDSITPVAGETYRFYREELYLLPNERSQAVIKEISEQLENDPEWQRMTAQPEKEQTCTRK